MIYIINISWFFFALIIVIHNLRREIEGSEEEQYVGEATVSVPHTWPWHRIGGTG